MGGAYVLLNTDPAQKAIKEVAEKELQKLLEVHVDIGKVHITPFTTIRLNDVGILTKEGDTILKANRLYAGIDPLALFRREIIITSINLSQFSLHLHKDSIQSPLNIAPILAALRPDKSKQSISNFDVQVDFVNLKEGTLVYDVYDQPITPKKLNVHHIKIDSLQAKFSLRSLKQDSLHIIVKQLSFKEQSGLQVTNLITRLTANKQQASIKELELHMPHSKVIMHDIKASDSINPFSLHAHISAQIKPSTISPKDLSSIFPILSHFSDPISLTALVSGQVTDSILIERVAFNMGKMLDFSSSGKIVSPLNKDIFSFWSDINHFTVTKEGIKHITKGLKDNQIKVPLWVHKLGDLSVKSQLWGGASELHTQTSITTDAGQINLVGEISTTHASHKAWQVNIESTQFNVSQLSPQADIGNVGLTIDVSGIGNSWIGSQIHAEGTISHLQFRDYTYQNILLYAEKEQELIQGKLSIDDPSGSLILSGRTNLLNGDNRSLSIKAKASSIQLDKLNIYTKEAGITTSLSLQANLLGNHIDNLTGEVKIDSVSFTKTGESLLLDKIYLFATKDSLSNQRHISLKSDLLDIDVDGNFSPSTLPNHIASIIDRYLPSIISKQELHGEELSSDSLLFDVKLQNTEALSQMFKLPFVNYSPSQVTGNINNATKSVDIQGNIPYLSLGGQAIFGTRIHLHNLQQESLSSEIESAIYSKNGIRSDIKLYASAENDTILSSIQFASDRQETFKGALTTLTHFSRETNKGLKTSIDILPETFILNDSIWRVHESNIRISENVVDIKKFAIENEHKSQSLKIEGEYSSVDPLKALSIQLNRIDLEYIFTMLRIKALQFGGVASGSIEASSQQGRPYYTCKLQVDDFSFYQEPIGTLSLYSQPEENTSKLWLKGEIINSSGESSIAHGYIDPIENDIDIDFEAYRINIGFLRGYIGTLFNQVGGTGSGKVKLSGNLSDVTVEGEAFIENGWLGVGITNTKYTFSDSIHMKKDLIYFNDIVFQDKSGNSAVCSGKVHHDYFNDITYHVSLDGQNLLVFEGTEEQNPVIFGTVFASGYGTIYGDEQEVFLDMRLQTEGNSLLRLNLMNETVNNYAFVSYKKAPTVKNTKDVLPIPASVESTENPMKVNMNFHLRATPQATLELVMDPVGGDIVRGNGEGDIQFKWDLVSTPEIFGFYRLQRGNYNFTFQKIMEKRFTLEEGSSIYFNGDPYAAELNLNALYRLTANLNDLNQSLSQTAGLTHTTVNCLLNITGAMRYPNVSFDITLPSTDAEVQRQVKNLISTEDMMNRQIAYLLLLSRFYTPEENSSDNGNFSYLASATLSANITKILNQIDPRWNFGTNIRTANSTNTSSTSSSDTEVELYLSSQLLNNRLLINGNFGYRDSPLFSNTFVSELDLEMLISHSGNLRLKAYNHLNEKYYLFFAGGSPVQTQGIGIIYKKDFNRLKDLLPRKRNTLLPPSDTTNLRSALIQDEDNSWLRPFIKLKKNE